MHKKKREKVFNLISRNNLFVQNLHPGCFSTVAASTLFKGDKGFILVAKLLPI